MFELLTRAEMSLLFFLLLFSWIAGGKAARLVYGGSPERMRRKARKMTFWAAFTSLWTLLIIAAIVAMTATLDPIFWIDRVALHLPFVAGPTLTLWVMAFPRLLSIRKASIAAQGGTLPAEVRALAASPALVVPFQATAIGAAVSLYFSLVTPIPLAFDKVLVPALVYAAAVYALTVLYRLRLRRISRPHAEVVYRVWRERLRTLGILAIAAGIATGLVALGMQYSRLPAEIAMDEGPMDYGGGTALAHDAVGAKSVALLTGPPGGTPDRTFTLTAMRKTVSFGHEGKETEVWTFNGQTPGPELRMKQGELIEVTLINDDIDEGVTIHWHGLDVPNAEDGVAGVTQDAVLPGEKHVYRFIAEQTGTYWYHSHQVSREAVSKGLFGPLIVEPASGAATGEDVTVMTHVWNGAGMLIGDRTGVQQRQVAPGTPVRLRITNTDDWVRQKYLIVGAPFQVAALDGTDLHEPGTLVNSHVTLTTGGRADLTFVMPETPVYLSVGGRKDLGILFSPSGSAEVPSIPDTKALDFARYGTPEETPFDANSDFDREFELVLDNRIGFYDGKFGSQYTINGEVFPNVPMFMVEEGDLVKTTIVNRGATDHPMHLHGHHMLVLSRNGEEVTGSPWWSDTLDVEPGDVYEVAFVADNPGLWMDHCHNLTHAEVGMSMHLMYDKVDSPYTAGRDTPNHPE